MYGYYKIAPTISPGKTVEGTIGSLFITTILSSLFFYQLHMTTSMLAIIIINSITCLAAFFGDLFESYLKRQARIKHASNLLPGHGGLLDRFDAIMSTACLFFLFKDVLIQYLTW
jgi:phosphatidate cytidylyltransferase